jgi:malate dehydrogenase (oxaloacetate-decarboxylating)(NADP+)
MIQFEDWSSEHAFGLLEKYQSKMLCFNDDIQGTGAVILSGVMNAIRRVEQENQVSPKDHRIVFYGAGSAAIGVARHIQEYFSREHNMTEDEAKRIFWIVDSKGMVTMDRGDKLAQHKVYYARDDNQGQQIKPLLDIVNYVKPTVLIGLSSTTGAFTTQVLERLAELNKNPIVFPLSNPATQAECTFEQAMNATQHRVIFASGTAFPAFTDPSGKTHSPGQGNNMYIFPGLGLGAVLARPVSISDRMIYMASKALANSLTPEEIAQGWLYPSLQRIRQVSAIVATAVCEEALAEGVAQEHATIGNKSHDELVAYVSSQMWHPVNSDAYGTSRI